MDIRISVDSKAKSVFNEAFEKMSDCKYKTKLRKEKKKNYNLTRDNVKPFLSRNNLSLVCK